MFAPKFIATTLCHSRTIKESLTELLGGFVIIFYLSRYRQLFERANERSDEHGLDENRSQQ